MSPGLFTSSQYYHVHRYASGESLPLALCRRFLTLDDNYGMVPSSIVQLPVSWSVLVTQIKDLKEISRERICELADQAVQTFSDAVRPIYGSTQQGTPEHIGSCIALRLRGAPY